MNTKYILLVLLLPVLAFEETRFSKNGSSLFEEKRNGNKIDWHSKEERFHIESQFDGPKAHNLNTYLYEDIVDEKWNNQSEGTISLTQTIKWGFDGKGYTKKIWEINAPGQDPVIEDEFYSTTEYGCCGDVNRYHYYSKWSGRSLGIFNEKLTPAPLGNRVRYLGYLVSAHYSHSDSVATKDKGSHGILFLLSDSLQLDKKVMVVKGDVWFPPKIETKLSSVDLTFEDGATVNLRIEGDSLVFAQDK